MVEKLSIQSHDQVSINIFHHKNTSKKMIIFTHGMSEYADRHDYLIPQLGGAYNIVSYDVRGHGSSPYSRGYIRRFHHYEQDLLRVIEHFSSQGYEISLMGHSMGGLITLGCLHRYGNQLKIEKVFLSGPALGAGDKFAVFLQKRLTPKKFKAIGKFLRHIPVRGSVNTKLLSHDPKVRENYKKDPRMLKHLKARMVMELLARGNELMNQACPVKDIIFIGGELDQIIDTSRIKEYCEKNNLSSQCHIIPGALHEIHFETSPMRNKFMSKLRDFFL